MDNNENIRQRRRPLRWSDDHPSYLRAEYRHETSDESMYSPGEDLVATRGNFALDSITVADREQKIFLCKQKVAKANQKAELLDQQIRELGNLYKTATENSKNSSRYNARMKLSVLTGIRMMYSHYCSYKEEEIRKLEAERFENLRNGFSLNERSSSQS